jgi:hypothetical protein
VTIKVKVKSSQVNLLYKKIEQVEFELQCDSDENFAANFAGRLQQLHTSFVAAQRSSFRLRHERVCTTVFMAQGNVTYRCVQWFDHNEYLIMIKTPFSSRMSKRETNYSVL